MLEKIKDIVRGNDTCVLATAGSDGPHASLMAYVCAPDATEIYLVTPRQTKKYRNILACEGVSLLVDTRLTAPRDSIQAVTIDGQASEVDSASDEKMVRESFGNRHPHLGDFVRQRDMAFIRIRISSFQLLSTVQTSHYVQLK